MLDLAQAMELLARHLEEPDTERLRTAMLRAVAGDRPRSLTEEEASALQSWFRYKYGQESDPAGSLYQAMLSWVLERGKDGGLHVRRQRGAHRATGAYYTQGAVVRYMLGRARSFMPNLKEIVDPACGSGAFLAGAIAELGGADLRLTGLDADELALEMCRENVPGAHLHSLDALLDHVPGEFDLCIGNPPYISSGLRGAAAQDPERQRRLKERYPATAQYKINTYPLFVERGLQLVREGGVLGYIVPDSFLSGRYFEGLRRLLLEHTLLELTLVREDFWEHGRVGQSVILFVRRGPAPPGHMVAVKVCAQVSDLEYAPAVMVPHGDLAWGPLRRFPLIVGETERALVQTMEAAAGGLRLGQLVRSYSGLIAKRGQQSLLRSAHAGGQGPWGRLLRSGREIDRYRLNWAGEEVCLDPALIKSGGHLPYYRNPKILLRQTADSLRAVYDDQGYYCLNNIHLLIPRSEDVPIHALLGVINSEPIDRFYRAVTMETGRLYPQVDLDLLEALPIPLMDQAAAERLASLVAQRENAASQEAAQVEADINRMVAALYGLV